MVTRGNIACSNGYSFSITGHSRNCAGLHGCERIRCGVCLSAQTRIQKASDQQEETEHHNSVEIGVLAAAESFEHADAKRQTKRERNRHIHIGVTIAERGP